MTRIFSIVSLIIGLAMTTWSGWFLAIREVPKPEINVEEEKIWLCRPSLAEFLGIQIPYDTFGMIAVFVVGLVITGISAGRLLPRDDP